MRAGDEVALLSIATTLMEASSVCSTASSAAMEGVTDPVGIKAKLDQSRVALEKVHELIDQVDGLMLDVLERIKKCKHPQEAHEASKNTFWFCKACGDVYTGLKWAAHFDEPTRD